MAHSKLYLRAWSNQVVCLALQSRGEREREREREPCFLLISFLHLLVLFPTIPTCLILPSLTPWATQLFSASLIFSVTLCPVPGCLCRARVLWEHQLRPSTTCFCCSHCPEGMLFQACPVSVTPEECVSIGWDIALQLLCWSGHLKKVSVKSLWSVNGSELGTASPSTLHAGFGAPGCCALGGGSSRRTEENKGGLVSRLYLACQETPSSRFQVFPTWLQSQGKQWGKWDTVLPSKALLQSCHLFPVSFFQCLCHLQLYRFLYFSLSNLVSFL